MIFDSSNILHEEAEYIKHSLKSTSKKLDKNLYGKLEDIIDSNQFKSKFIPNNLIKMKICP